MNGYLLDTNSTLLALTEPARLSARARRAIRAGPNVLSVVVYWEVVLKAMKGALSVDRLDSWWPDAIDQLAATALFLKPEHVSHLTALPSIHRDPFDRALIVQAMVEDLALVTIDAVIPRYAPGRFRVIG